MRLLIDEQLSPKLVQWAAELGVYTLSGPHAGLAGKPDAFLWRYAFDHLLTADLAVGDDVDAGVLQIADRKPGRMVLGGFGPGLGQRDTDTISAGMLISTAVASKSRHSGCSEAESRNP